MGRQGNEGLGLGKGAGPRRLWKTLIAEPGRCLPAVVSRLPMILVSGDVHHALLAASSDHSFLWHVKGALELRSRRVAFQHTYTHTYTPVHVYIDAGLHLCNQTQER